MATSRFSANHGIVPMALPVVDNGNAGFTTDSVDMSKYNHATLLFIFNADYAGTGVLTMNAGLADAGTDAIPVFTYRYGGAAAGSASADVLSAPTVVESTTLNLAHTTYAGRILVIEVDAEDMVVSGVQYRYLSATLSDAGTDGEIAVIGILSEPRYAKGIMPTAIPTS